MNLNLTTDDHNFLTALRITAEPDPVPFDAAAAEAMIQFHRISEARQRERVAELEAELERVNAVFQEWIVSGDEPERRGWTWEALVVGLAVGVLVGWAAWGRG